MATEAILSRKGRAIIPKEIRDGLRLRSGDRMSFTVMPDGTVLLRAKNKRFTELAGMLYREGRPIVPIEKLSL